MSLLWRISNHCDLSGVGGEKTDGRWHTAARGKRIVYLSESPSLALIEVLANLKGNPNLFPETYQLMKVSIAETVSIKLLDLATLSDGWKNDLAETRAQGDEWLRDAPAALLAVPSVPCPESINYLFNPLHRDAGGLRIEWCRSNEWDRRLFHVR